MTDKELLELAAKAAGITLDFTGRGVYPPYYVNERGGHTSWNPLESDGDCARLETQLNLKLEWFPGAVLSGGIAGCLHYFWDYENDKQKARRYAAVGAAAEIGKQKE
jgi:hypothetical protein